MDDQNFNQSIPESPQQMPSVMPESKPNKMVLTILRILTTVVVLVAGGYFLLITNKHGSEVPVQISTNKSEDETSEQILTNKSEDKTPEQILTNKSEDETPEQILTNNNKNNHFTISALSKKLIQPEEITSTTSSVNPQVPAYSLPLNISQDISNWSTFSDRMNLSDSAKSLLSKNGFVNINNANLFSSKDDFAGFYSEIQKKDLPVFITTDSLLHYYHVFFDTSLMRMEKDIFYDDTWQMSKKFYDDSLNIYQNTSDPLVKEAARRNVAYLATALELLKPKPDQIVTVSNVKNLVDCYNSEEGCAFYYENAIKNGTFSTFGQEEADKYSFTSPDFVNDLVSKELQLIDGHKGWSCSPIFLYQEDYSQYVPRGHYTKSEKLRNYFKAFTWYGRITGLIKGSANIGDGQCVEGGRSDGFISANDAQIQTLQALILARKFALEPDIQKSWNKIYAITSFFVGFSDDLGPVEYSSALMDIFGNNVDVNSLAGRIADIQKTVNDKFADPKIYSGLGRAEMVVVPQPPLTEEQISELKKQADQLLANTKGFRMMGQRFVVDSYLFSKIVTPYSGEYTGTADKVPFTYVVTGMGRKVRGFPRGLDIMALLGSERAQQIIKDLGDADYSDFQSQFDNLKKEVDILYKDNWHQNLYWNWLYVLKALIVKFESGYPSFMQTTAWQDKELNTALASWSELRHDTILYVKQSCSMAEKGGGDDYDPRRVVGYVEPVPLFYARLLDLTKMNKKGLTNLLSQNEWNKIGVGDAMNHFETILSRLVDISKAELENRELTDDDYNFIKYFGHSLDSISRGLIANYGDIVDPEMFKTTLIADVHTDGNTDKVLEEGTGYIRPIIVAYKLPQNYILVGVGPVFSYYEFKQPMGNRLTDEEWRSILQTNPPTYPEWIKSFSE